MLPTALTNDRLGANPFQLRWDPDIENRDLADAAFAELMDRLRQVNVDDLFDPARLERHGARLSAGERAHLAAGKMLFLTRLAILEELGPQIFYDAYGL